MNFLNLEVINGKKNKRSCVCFLNRTDPARNWQLGGEYSIANVLADRSGWCIHLGDNPSPGAITGSVDGDDDPQTSLELLGI